MHNKIISILMLVSTLLILISTLLLNLYACKQPEFKGEAKSNQQRISSPDVTEANLSGLVAGNNDFALDLYQSLHEEEGNLFYSPYSISMALAMTCGGARGDTESEIAKTLHYMLPQNNLHNAFNALDQELNSRGKGSQGKDGKGFRLNIVNAIWGQKGYQFLPDYLDLLAVNYGAGLRILDFMNATEESRININNWVSAQTEGKIKDLIPRGAIDQLTRLVLTNAIYFNAAWQHSFEKNSTTNDIFHLLTGNDISVPMMRQTESFRYTGGNDFQAVELPYDGRELSMLIIVPEPGQFKTFESSLTMDRLNAIIKQLSHGRVALTMPKFEFDFSLGLKEKLKTMGMPLAFSGQADFSGMDGKRDLYITDVLHKAFVSVDESGTEAAAATAVIVGATAMPEQPVEITIDHPFIFMIRDIKTGSILFLGRVLNPAK
ncbi:MAG: serpin family protein [Dehalococcoidia bacterium]|nr:serpin family protein [Dehalococcoidia bacterium]MDD5495090.1 serpin family protein [Dehalococcoidia bacterium]